MRARWRRADEARAADGGTTSPEVMPDALAELLHDVKDLRLTLAADLSAAAGAVDHDADDVAAHIVDADRRELAAFARRAVERLTALEAGPDVEPVPAPRQPSSWRRRALISLPAVPLAGALAMSAAAAAGLLPVPGHTSHADSRPSVRAVPPVASTFAQFENVLAGDPSRNQVMRIAATLHQQIAALIATVPQNPAHVSEVAQLLQLEQALLLRTQPPGSGVVLAASRELAATLLKVAPQLQSTSQPTPAFVPTTQPTPRHTHPAQSVSSTPTPATTAPARPAPTTSPTPAKSTPTAPQPSPSSTSTSTPGHLPGITK